MLLGYKDQYFSDAFWDKVEELPNYMIIQREVQKALLGKSFFVFSKDRSKKHYVEGVSLHDFLYYYKIWENCNSFGLPHGSGWMEERSWLLEFVKMFNKAQEQVNNFLEDLEYRKIKNNNG